MLTSYNGRLPETVVYKQEHEHEPTTVQIQNRASQKADTHGLYAGFAATKNASGVNSCDPEHRSAPPSRQAKRKSYPQLPRLHEQVWPLRYTNQESLSGVARPDV